MSAIAGIVRFDGKNVEPREIEGMLDSMPHRGPDGSNTDIWNCTGFGHNMLFTTSESLLESLPMRSSAGGVMLTCDARIDNRDELLEQLNIPNESEKPITDADIVLHSYIKWGQKCASKLIGVFSVAIWDSGKNELICFRDLLGLKPLYYFQSDEFFAFATEVKALLTLEGVPNRLNETRVGDFLTEFRLDHEITIFQNIFKVPPAHLLSIIEGEKRLDRYAIFKPDPSVAEMNEADYVARFRELMTEAVRCRVRSAFPIASQLSGGLDSSYVTCLARDILKEEDKRVQSISMIFDEITECDERSFIQLVLDEGDIDAHFLHADQFGPLKDLEEIHKFVDDGYCSGNHHLVWRMIRLAKEKQCRIMLDGIDGDSTVDHGIGRFRELASQGDWRNFATEVSRSVDLHHNAKHQQDLQILLGSSERLLREYAAPQLEEFAKSGDFYAFAKSVVFLRREYRSQWSILLRRNWFRLFVPSFFWQRRARIRTMNEPIAEIVNKSFAEQHDIVARREKYRHRKPESSVVRETQANLFNSAYATNEHETTEHYAAAHQIELRHPFLDQRLIEFCLALPASQSFSDGWTRRILRQAMESLVPKDISWRSGKGSMRANFKHGYFTIDRALLEKYSSDLGLLTEYVDREVLARFLSDGKNLPIKKMMSLAATIAISVLLNKKFTGEKSDPRDQY